MNRVYEEYAQRLAEAQQSPVLNEYAQRQRLAEVQRLAEAQQSPVLNEYAQRQRLAEAQQSPVVNEYAQRQRLAEARRLGEEQPFATVQESLIEIMIPERVRPSERARQQPVDERAQRAQRAQREVKPVPDEPDDKYKTSLVQRITCQICLVNESDTALSPCGHIVCSNCASKITKCPTCRQNITNKMPLYYQKYLKYKNKYLNARKKIDK